MRRIVLNMIVKNEARVIERCLSSVVRHIDYWLIDDTGSKDDTPGIIVRLMQKHGVAGELRHRTWRDFGVNRSEAVCHAAGQGSHILLMDADCVLQVEGDFSTDLDTDIAPPGLDESVVRLISSKKDEPEWLLEWRLKAYRRFLQMLAEDHEPTWANVSFPKTSRWPPTDWCSKMPCPASG